MFCLMVHDGDAEGLPLHGVFRRLVESSLGEADGSGRNGRSRLEKMFNHVIIKRIELRLRDLSVLI
jgi:hypothetical protein